MARETFDEVLKRRDGYTQEEVDETSSLSDLKASSARKIIEA